MREDFNETAEIYAARLDLMKFPCSSLQLSIARRSKNFRQCYCQLRYVKHAEKKLKKTL